jgi:hypothetical protein
MGRKRIALLLMAVISPFAAGGVMPGLGMGGGETGAGVGESVATGCPVEQAGSARRRMIRVSFVFIMKLTLGFSIFFRLINRKPPVKSNERRLVIGCTKKSSSWGPPRKGTGPPFLASDEDAKRRREMLALSGTIQMLKIQTISPPGRKRLGYFLQSLPCRLTAAIGGFVRIAGEI